MVNIIRRNKNNNKKYLTTKSSLRQDILITDTAADQCTCGGPVWYVLNETGERVKCNGYMKGEFEYSGPSLPLVSAITCVELQDEPPFLLRVNQACYYDDQIQDKSLCLPFQAEQHGVTFNLTPRDRADTAGNLGKQNMVIEGKDIPLNFDNRKMYISIRATSEEEIDKLEIYELVSPEPFAPEVNYSHNLDHINHRRKQHEIIQEKYTGGFTIER